MKYLITIITFSLFLFASCKNNESHNNTVDHESHEQVNQSEDIHDGAEHHAHQVAEEERERQRLAQIKEDQEVAAQHQSEGGSLHLNNGKKWIVNDATHVGMTNIKALLTDYVKNDKTDHVALAAAMSKESSTLISKCDMVGPDHDMLHVILVPILESIEEIKESRSAQPIMDLSVYLSEYFKHFRTE